MFTYDNYLDILNMGLAQGKELFVRHDVDMSLQKAVQMAEIEANLKIKATYYILFSSPFYNALSKNSLAKMQMIKDMGMGIGIHFDAAVKEMPVVDMRDEILVQAGLLEHHLGPLEGMSCTFHRTFMGKSPNNRLISMLNSVDIYSPDYDRSFHYISDSGHNWREDPIEAMMKYAKIHINVHPEWYNDEYCSMEECLHELNLDGNMDRLINNRILETKEYLLKIK